jgi:hypothetical protein
VQVALVALAMGGVMAAAACGRAGPPVTGTSTETAASRSWREIPGSPLVPREAALGLWTGREVLLIGGSDASRCPPGADCAADSTPLADGAAVDPRAGSCRRLAYSPVPFSWGRGVVVGQTAYILPGTSGPADADELLAYQIDQDRWHRPRCRLRAAAVG